MDTTQIIVICITAVISFGGIALAIFYGLSGFRKGVVKELTEIKEKVIKIENTAEKLWDLARTPPGGVLGTITVTLKSLGETKVSAEPGLDKTVYFIEVGRGNLSDAFITRFCKDKELVQTELRLFGEEPEVDSIRPRLIKVTLPSTNPKISTEYLSIFLKTLDELYQQGVSLKKDFEKGISI